MLLVSPDLSGCLYPDCHLADTGVLHTRSGANYTGTCTVCHKRYRGETGFNAHARLDTHEKQIRGSVQATSMARHLTEEHGRDEHIPPAIRPLAPGHLLDNEAMRGDERRGAGR